MAEAAAVAVVASTAYQIYANEEATKEKKKIAQEEAKANQIEANEMLARYEINKSRLTKDYTKYLGDVRDVNVKAGLANTPLYVLEQVNRDYQEEMYNMQREAQFKSNQMYREGDFANARAKSIANTGRTQSYGLFMQGAAQTAGMYANRK
jgi:hypothetical protein